MKRSAPFAFSLVLALALIPMMGVAAGVPSEDVLPVSDKAFEEALEDAVEAGGDEGEEAAPEEIAENPLQEVRNEALEEPSEKYALAEDAPSEDAPTNDATLHPAVRDIPYIDAKYLDEKGEWQNCPEATAVTADENEWTNGWYIALNSVSIDERIVISGSVNLILANGCTLNANKGITVSAGNSFTVYAQSTDKEQAGSLNATGSWGAGIGGYAIEQGDTRCDCGTVTINGGNVSAQGSSGCAGIGGAGWGNAYFTTYGNCGTVTINGGWVTAKGAGKSLKATAAAAIGNSGGGSGGTIRITGGTVTVEPSGVLAAAIGGGADGRVGTIVVSGGHIIANVNTSASSSNHNPCIGKTMSLSTGSNGTAFIETNDPDFTGNNWGFTSGIILNDGNYYIQGNQVLDGDAVIAADKVLQLYSSATLTIPAGVTLTNNNIIKSNANTTLVVDGRLVNNGAIENNGGLIKGTGTLEGDKAAANKPPAPAVQAVGATSVELKPLPDVGCGPVEYGRTAGGGTAAPWQSSSTFDSLNPNTEYTFYARYIGNEFYTDAWSDGTTVTTANYRVFYVDAGGTQVRTPADVNVVRITPSYLASNGNELASGWYVVEEDMAIDAARILVKEGADVHLILGDGIQMSCGRGITVPSSSSLSIYGQSADDAIAGILLATGGNGRAAIGGDGLYTCGSISINSGIVMARGGDGAAGIGAGRLQKVGTIEINGGFVRSFGGDGGCAIGGGENSSTGSVSISGGTIEAVGKNATAIGSAGMYAQDVHVTISGGTLRLGSLGGEAVIGGAQRAKVSLAMEGGLVYGFGDASAMAACDPFAMTGGAMVFAANGDENAAMTDRELTTSDPATVTVAGFAQGIQVPAGTKVSATPTIMLPANGQASFTSTKGEPVTITAAASAAPMRFKVEDGLGAVFLPTAFVAEVGAHAPVVSPEGGMWLAADGAMESSADGDPGEGGASGNDSGAAGTGGQSGDGNIAPSFLGDTGDGMASAAMALLAVMAIAVVVAFRSASASPAKRAKHARKA